MPCFGGEGGGTPIMTPLSQSVHPCIGRKEAIVAVNGKFLNKDSDNIFLKFEILKGGGEGEC